MVDINDAINELFRQDDIATLIAELYEHKPVIKKLVIAYSLSEDIDDIQIRLAENTKKVDGNMMADLIKAAIMNTYRVEEDK